MLISPKNKYIFFKPMKCAGSSVEKSLLTTCTELALCTGGSSKPQVFGIQHAYDEYPHVNNKFIDEKGRIATRFHSHTWPGLFFEKIKNKKEYRDYHMISVARNPFSQLVSWYWWNYPEMTYNPLKERMLIYKSDSNKIIKYKFNLFLNYIGSFRSCQAVDKFLNVSYLKYIADINESFIDDRVRYIKYENLNHDFNNIFSKITGRKLKLDKLKSSFKKINIHYTNYYDKFSVKSVNDCFPKTINTFHYKLK